MENIAPALLDWFYTNRRILPFREDPTPYHVWLSEIMLQQTRVSAALPYYERFLAALPDIPALAGCEEEKLHKLWEGLGYYSRVRNLQKAAKIVCAQYGGQLPADYNALLTLPGIGEYTAGAIASISFGLPVPAVDGNVLRVFARLYNDPRLVTDPQVKALAIESFFRDKYNRLWIGTYGNGLFCFDNEKRGIKQIAPINQDNISAATVLHELGEDKMLIGTQGNGLFVCNQKNGELFPKPMSDSEQVPNLNYIQTIYLDKELLIVGHDHLGFCYVEHPYENRMNFKLKSFQPDQRLGKVTSIYRDRDSLFWIGTKQNGLVSLRYQNKPAGGVFHI